MWLRRALTISTPEPGSYYTAIDPVDYYEWKFTGVIPQGSVFTRCLPSSDAFTKGRVIASAVLPEESVKKVERGYKLERDTDARITLTAGDMSSQHELIDRYKELRSLFDRQFSGFTQALQSNKFLVTASEIPHLYEVIDFNDNEVELVNYGPFEEVVQKLTIAQDQIGLDAARKKGRAYEMSDLMRYTNSMTSLDAAIPLDQSKMKFMLNVANIKSSNSRKLSWQDCFLNTSNQAQVLNDILHKFNSYSWVHHY